MRALVWLFGLLALGCASAEDASADGTSAPQGKSADAGIDSAVSFVVTSIEPIGAATAGGASDWVCGGAFFRVKGNGFVEGMKLFLGDGRAPFQRIDEHNAIIQAPPGNEGAVDVKITNGSTSATTLAGFSYRTLSVESESPWKKVPATSPHPDLPSIGVLQDGRALVTGGFFTAAADLFTLDSEQAEASAAPMNSGRWDHSTVVLLNGKAAMFGASGCCMFQPNTNADSKIADLFDPAGNVFVKAKGNPAEFFIGARSVLLVDGRVLILAHLTTNAEIYDPVTEQFTTISGAPLIDYYQFVGHQYLARLRDGRVLLVTGQGRNAYYFDPDTNSFSDAGKGPAAGPDALITLPDGRVIAIAGSVITGGSAPDWKGAISNASDVVEIFDPQSGAGFSPAPYKLLHPRVVSAATLGRDGDVLVIGGATGSFPAPYGCGSPAVNENPTELVDRIDPVAGTVTPFAPLPEKVDYLTAVTMLDGSAVVAGGGLCNGGISGNPYIFYRKAEALVH